MVLFAEGTDGADVGDALFGHLCSARKGTLDLYTHPPRMKTYVYGGYGLIGA